MIGKTLAHYEITTKLGQGGMGSVWRARDTKLGREVAIKTLPDEFAQDADRVARFQREAKLLASLNHPNIAAIHGLEEDDGIHFLVLELVEGDTLEDRIKRGAIPVEEALKLALQIADALKAAHDSGVVHRDLKPSNIKITDDDNVKVLDFGLAKALEGDTAEANMSQSPTLSMAATQAGLILGTAAYMSPEQAKGRAVDKRADIFAFGCVLYEMLTGRQSFGKSDVTESLSAVISLQPEWDTLPRNLHPRLRETVERCLEKQVAKRYQDIGDVQSDIERVLADPSGVIVQPVAEVVQAARQAKLPWVVAVLGILVAGLGGWYLRTPEPGRVTRFSFQVPDGSFAPVNRPLLAISPDGDEFLYNTNLGLFLRSIDELEARVIPGTEMRESFGLFSPTFSPDGEWVTYWNLDGQQLEKIPVAGGAPVVLAEVAGSPQGISWDVEETILYQAPEGIMSISANGGEPELVVPLLGGTEVDYPQLLPGGNAVLFEADGSEVGVQSLDSGEARILFPGRGPRYVRTGHLVYEQAGVLFAVPFDIGSLEVTGGPGALLEGVRPNQYALSDSGSLIYLPGIAGADVDQTLALMDRDGQIEPIGMPAGSYFSPRVSPDGTRIAYVTSSGDGDENVDVWIYNLSGALAPRQLTFGGVSRFPIWSADGERVAFQSNREGDMGIFWQRADGTGGIDRLTTPDEGEAHIPDSFSSSEGMLSFTVVGDGESIVSTLALQDGELTPFAAFAGAVVGQSVFSPDGRWIAYQSNETGEDEIFVQPFPPTGAKYQLPNTFDNHHPVWSPDGDELFYVPGPRLFAVVRVTTAPSFEFGNPDSLSGQQFVAGGPTAIRSWDIMPDGEQFVARVDSSAGLRDGGSGINVVLNWFEELKERVPVD